MDVYTVIFCTSYVVSDDDCLRANIEIILNELHAEDSNIQRSHEVWIAVATPSCCCSSWHHIDKVTDVDDLLEETTPTHNGGVCDVLEKLADQLPARDVIVNLVWCSTGHEERVGEGPLLVTLMRYCAWRGAVLRILPAEAGEMEDWRRVLCADDAASLRPTVRAALRFPETSVTSAISVEMTCDVPCWRDIMASAGHMHGGDVESPLTLSALDGFDAVERVSLSSVPLEALSDLRLKVRPIGGCTWPEDRAWREGRVAILVRLLHNIGVGSPDLYDGAAWRRYLQLLVDGSPVSRRVSPTSSRHLHFLLMTTPDGGAELARLDVNVALQHLPAVGPPLPDISAVELVALVSAEADDFKGDGTKDGLFSLLRQPFNPASWPERRALTYWDSVHVGRGAGLRQASDSLVLDADGILRAIASAGGVALKPSTGASENAAWLEEVKKIAWPEVANIKAHGVHYNLSTGAESSGGSGAAFKERRVANETACTCSVWRSDAISIPTGDRRKVLDQSKSLSPRRSPRQQAKKRAAGPARDEGRTAGSFAGGRRSTQSVRAKKSHQTGEKTDGPKSVSSDEQQKQRLRRAIWAALSERGIKGQDMLFRGCARKLAGIVRAYTEDSQTPGGATSRQMLEIARVHVKHVIEVQKNIDASKR